MIEDIIIEAVHKAPFREVNTVQDLLDADAWGREFALAYIRKAGEK